MTDLDHSLDLNDTPIETHPLPPFLPRNAKLLMMGSFPPPQSRWKMDFYYPNYQNDMWRIFGLIFFADKDHFLDLPNKNFKELQIREFLTQQGIAIYDTAYQVQRLKGNAADKFLVVTTPTDLKQLLSKIPDCHALMTTGDKATDTMMLSMPSDATKPSIGHSGTAYFADRQLKLYRMPSSSRAYPLSLENKANAYRDFFKETGLL